VAPGAAIGGDRFGNREARLPSRWNGRYAEADLDYAGGHRGINRLIFVRGMGAGEEEWLLFVTTDHERNFTAFVPAR
jgi:guanyl-specific ribonuclease Sa